MEDGIPNNPACDNVKLEAETDSSVVNGVTIGEGPKTLHKPFKTIDEQIEILNRRGLLTDDSTHLILEREGYYPVVNGYKDFLGYRPKRVAILRRYPNNVKMRQPLNLVAHRLRG